MRNSLLSRKLFSFYVRGVMFKVLLEVVGGYTNNLIDVLGA